MKRTMLIDNWLLQDVKELFEEGLSRSYADEIQISPDFLRHKLNKIPYAIIQIESLFSLVESVVFSDFLLLDSKWAWVWDSPSTLPSLKMLKDLEIITPFPFRERIEEIIEPRKVIVQELCVTTSLLDIQKANEKSWEEKGKVIDNYMSQIIWGGAGYLARSHIWKAPYSGHPLRERVIKKCSLISLPVTDAQKYTLEWLQKGRTKLASAIYENRISNYASFSLPAVVVEVLEEANSLEEIITQAVMLRDKYADLRRWIGEYQKALEIENSKELVKKKKLLDSVAKSIESDVDPVKYGSVELSLGASSFGIKKKLDMSRVLNRWGVRSVLRRLHLERNGRNSLKRLMRFLEVEHTSLGSDLLQSLVERYSPPIE